MNISGVPENKNVPALLFVPFIENAIKHCDKNVDSPGIVINMNIKDNGLIFDMFNFIPASKITDSEGGIGLNNIKRRLELLYPGKHKLEIINDERKFEVFLELQF